MTWNSSATTVNTVSNYLSTLAGTYPLLPQKLLVVHDFHRTELPDR